MRHGWEGAFRPQRVFPAWAAAPQGPRRALAGMLAWRIPVGVLGAVATVRALLSGLDEFRRLEGPWAQALLAGAPGLAPEDLQTALADLPKLPSLYGALPWILLAVPLGLLGAWLHHSVWDHGCLWLLRGLRKEHPWQATLEAEALALQVGAVGAALGLLSLAPGLGPRLWPLLLGVDLWFWCLRGVALAAFHECPLWKGVVATLLHGAILVLVGCGLLGLLLLLFGLSA